MEILIYMSDGYVSLSEILEDLGMEVSAKLDKYDVKDSFENNILRVYGYNLKLIRSEMRRHTDDVTKHQLRIQNLKRKLWRERMIGFIFLVVVLIFYSIYSVYVRV